MIYHLGLIMTQILTNIYLMTNKLLRKYPWKHDDVIKWKHFPCYWPFVRGIHRSPVNSPYKGQWRGALMFSLICPRINGWVNNCEAGDLRRIRPHYDVIVMVTCIHRSTWYGIAIKSKFTFSGKYQMSTWQYFISKLLLVMKEVLLTSTFTLVWFLPLMFIIQK